MNLISNAIRFTRNRERAVIEVRARLKEDNEVEISAHDNGVGFDMRFLDKLYAVFQRLHRESEFEGTGIGLANSANFSNLARASVLGIFSNAYPDVAALQQARGPRKFQQPPRLRVVTRRTVSPGLAVRRSLLRPA